MPLAGFGGALVHSMGTTDVKQWEERGSLWGLPLSSTHRHHSLLDQTAELFLHAQRNLGWKTQQTGNDPKQH